MRLMASSLGLDPVPTGASLSKSTIHRILQNHNLKPHRSRYFLHISDPYFFPKMEHLVDLYLHPPKNLFCFDESPGIQVLQRLVSDMRTEATKIRLEEFEYIKHGTIDLFACLEVSTGKVFSECRCNHNTAALVDFLQKHLLTLPDNEPIHYVLDNLNTHCSYDLCKVVAQYSNTECPPETELDNMGSRRKWLSENNKRIVFHFTPFHGSWLNMVEIWFGIMSGKCLKESFATPEDMYNAINGFTDIWNTLMAHPFNWQYTGEELHEKTVRRFIQNLQTDGFIKTELRVLTKQLQLMKNMINQYQNCVSEECWNELRKVLQVRIDSLMLKIGAEAGERRKAKAQVALEELTAILFESKINEIAA